MSPSQPVSFILGIRATVKPDGSLIEWSVQHENRLAEEVVLSVMRSWLRAFEDDYHARFLLRK